MAGAAMVVLAGCGGSATADPSAPAGSAAAAGSAATSAPASPSIDPSTPTGWGPTVGELAAAQAEVATWTPAQLAGQVIVGRWYGTDPAEASSLVADLGLAGVQLTGANIADGAQVQAVTQAVSAAVAASGRDFPAVIGVDQEGGAVAHLSGVTADLPAFAAAGNAVATGEAGGQAVTRAMAAAALELRGLGFTWVFAPVADVTIGSADPIIGSRSPSGDPAIAGQAVAAAVEGYNEAGIVSTVKHFPGHGSATDDSHLTLPVIGSSMAELEARDLVPFVAGIDAGAPAVMVGHLDVTSVAPGLPSSLAPQTYTLLRDGLGFEGVAITDSLGMGAVMSQDGPATMALNAGADLLLMPADTRAAHAELTQAITTGTVPRARAEEAAARVVALQRWQQRAGAADPVPADAGARATAAVQQMVAAGG